MPVQGPKSPTAATSAPGMFVAAWTNPTSITTSNNSYATVAFSSHAGSTVGGMPWLFASGFGFNVPTNAEITGIVATVEGKRGGGTTSNVYFRDVYLTKGEKLIAGSSQGTGVALPTSEEVRTYGGDTNLWDTSWTPAEVNAATFGLGIRPIANEVIANRMVFVDHVTISVHYKVNTRVMVDTSAKFVNDVVAPTTLNRFIPPAKTTAVANGTDVVLWERLPKPTHFHCEVFNDVPEQNPNWWDVEEGFFEATFHPAGKYVFTLSSPGYEDLHVTINAVGENAK